MPYFSKKNRGARHDAHERGETPLTPECREQHTHTLTTSSVWVCGHTPAVTIPQPAKREAQRAMIGCLATASASARSSRDASASSTRPMMSASNTSCQRAVREFSGGVVASSRVLVSGGRAPHREVPPFGQPYPRPQGRGTARAALIPQAARQTVQRPHSRRDISAASPPRAWPPRRRGASSCAWSEKSCARGARPAPQ